MLCSAACCGGGHADRMLFQPQETIQHRRKWCNGLVKDDQRATQNPLGNASLQKPFQILT
jgi:hypothetical protein